MLFQTGNFTSAGGLKLNWKIECDALSQETLAHVAAIVAPRIPKFSLVLGVPNGGIRVAEAFKPYAIPGVAKILICEDVWTTGSSWRRFVAEHKFRPLDTLGFCLFSRDEKRLPGNIYGFFECGIPNPNNRG